MLPDLFDFFHIVWLFVAGYHEIDEREEGPSQKGNVEHIVLVKGRVKPEVPDLQPEYHVYLSVMSVAREGTYAQLHHPH